MRELSLNRQEVDYKGVKRCTDIFVNMPDLFDKDEDFNIYVENIIKTCLTLCIPFEISLEGCTNFFKGTLHHLEEP